MLIAQSLIDQVTLDMLTELNSQLAGVPVIQFWNGTMPTTPEDPDTGTLIAELACSGTVWGTLAGNVTTMNSVTPGTCVADGDIDYVRLKPTSGGACIVQWEVGADFTIVGGTAFTGEDISVDVITATLVVVGG